MTIQANSPEEYIAQVPGDRQAALIKLREILLHNLPDGFEEMINYNMIGYVVSKSLYPQGYHCDPKLPLPFMNIASQKNFIALYHMGLYADKALYDWFTAEYPKYNVGKLDMGKSCIRFKNTEKIPYALIEELARKMTAEQYIQLYETQFRSGGK